MHIIYVLVVNDLSHLKKRMNLSRRSVWFKVKLKQATDVIVLSAVVEPLPNFSKELKVQVLQSI